MFRPDDYWVQRAIAAPEDIHRERRLEHLRALRLKGSVVSETEEGWDLARRAWNLAADQRPPHVAFPETSDDIVKLVKFAGGHGLRVAPQGTGHGAGPLGTIEDAVLLRPSRMCKVEISPDRRLARVGAGVTWREVQAAAAKHGLAGLAGSSLEVGVLGYTLGGGLGWFGRRYGLACNSVLGFQVVAADGRRLWVDGLHDPDLFWALRGGGGSFGVVAALDFALYPVRELYAGAMFWPQEHAGEVLHAWREWTAEVPDSVTSVARVVNLPPASHIPAGLGGRSFVLVEAACLTTQREGTELLRPLRRLRPQVDTFRMMPPASLGALHMDPVDPVPLSFDGWLLADLPSQAVDGIIEQAGPGSGSPLLSVELRHLGGALLDASPEHGALAGLDARFATVVMSLVPDAETASTVRRWSGALRAALASCEAERNYPNFAERSSSLSDFFSPSACERLQRVKRQYDPEDLIRSTHPVAVA
jgi:FAD/FMN-containing dehydrogenase